MDIKINRRILSAFFMFSFYFIFMFFSGCASKHSSSDYVSNIQIPEWVTNPSKNGIIGGVGYCAAHINGYAGQKELASKRALEDIARQKGVLVNSIMHVSSKFSNSTKLPDTTSKNISSYQTKKNVKAYIKEIWVHPVSKEMYVYMIAE